MSLEKAKLMLNKGEILEASKLLLDMVEKDPKSSSAWLLLCGIATRTQNWELGVKSFSGLAKLRPSSHLASSGLVQSLYNSDRHVDTLKEIKRFKSVADINLENDRDVMVEHQKIADVINSK